MMPSFSFTARDDKGVTQKGELEASSSATAAAMLRQRGWLVLQIQNQLAEVTENSSLWSFSFKSFSPSQWRSPSSVDVENGLRQIALILRSGMTLVAALNVVMKYSQKQSMKVIWGKVMDQVERGLSLADAFRSHSCFPEIVVQLTAVGEQSGSLDDVLKRAADNLENRRSIKGNLVTAMMYPAFIVVFAIGVTFFLMLYLVPKFEKALGSMGKKMPAMTQMLIDLSHWMTAYWQFLLAGGIFMIAGLVLFYKRPKGRLMVDTLLLKIPIIGNILRVVCTISFCRSLELLVHSGITLLQSLRTIEDLLPNRYASRTINQACDEVLQGKNLGNVLEDKACFTPMLPNMVAVGETSGNMEDVLNEVAVFHEAQLKTLIKRLSALVEPIILLFVGGVVGFVYISFFLALFSVSGA